MNTETTQDNDEVRSDWPLWKATLRELRDLPGFGYGMELPIDWFEKKLVAQPGTQAFAFAFLNIAREVESENGYSLQQRTIRDAKGADRLVIQIPSGSGHGEVAHTWECKMRSYAKRAHLIREKTLANPEADLTPEEKIHMEKEAEIAATRVILLHRERKISEYLKANAPKLLEKKKDQAATDATSEDVDATEQESE